MISDTFDVVDVGESQKREFAVFDDAMVLMDSIVSIEEDRDWAGGLLIHTMNGWTIKAKARDRRWQRKKRAARDREFNLKNLPKRNPVCEPPDDLPEGESDGEEVQGKEEA